MKPSAKQDENYTFIHVWEEWGSDYLIVDVQPTYFFLCQKVSDEGMVLRLSYLMEPSFYVAMVLAFLHYVIQILFF